MKTLLTTATATAALAMAASASAAVTGSTGLGLPFDNFQPSLAVTEVVPLTGIFPDFGGNGSAIGDTLGFVYDFAGNFAPGGGEAAQGQLLPIAQNPALFSLLGYTYGSSGPSTFALPNLQGRVVIGAGAGLGLSTQILGAATGSSTVTLGASQIPPHDHTLPSGGVTGTTGGGQPFSNMQPSLPLQPMIAVRGTFPTRGGNTGSAAFLGQIADYAGSATPAGWLPADGRLLSIAQNQALFAILGNTYGGNGVITFGLPDLRGRTAVGADTADPLGARFGEESTTLTVAQLPPHVHTLPGGGFTGSTGGGQPVINDQPSLALNYLIATSGIFPSRSGGSGFDPNTPTLGEITEFAGNFAPSGWMFADGQILSIAANPALFSVIGTQYGGNGTSNFALPDLQGRTLVGAGLGNGVDYVPGESFGSDTTTLKVAYLPPHDHTLPPPPTPVPEPAGLALLGLGLAGAVAARRLR